MASISGLRVFGRDHSETLATMIPKSWPRSVRNPGHDGPKYAMSSGGLILINAHGNTADVVLNGKNETIIEFTTNTKIGSSLLYKEEQANFELVTIVTKVDKRYGITPNFIDSLPRFPNSIVLASICHSAESGTIGGSFGNAFLGNGAGAFVGYNGRISSEYGSQNSYSIAKQLVSDMATIGEAVKASQPFSDTYEFIHIRVPNEPASRATPVLITNDETLRLSPELRFIPKSLSFDYDVKKDKIIALTVTASTDPTKVESTSLMGVSSCGHSSDSIALQSQAPWVRVNPNSVSANSTLEAIEVGIITSLLPEEKNNQTLKTLINVGIAGEIQTAIPVEVGTIDFDVEREVPTYDLGSVRLLTQGNTGAVFHNGVFKVINRGTRALDLFSDDWIKAERLILECNDPSTATIDEDSCLRGLRPNGKIPSQSETQVTISSYLKDRTNSLAQEAFAGPGRYQGLLVLGRTAPPNEFTGEPYFDGFPNSGIFRNTVEFVQATFEVKDDGSSCPSIPEGYLGMIDHAVANYVSPRLNAGDPNSGVTFVVQNQPVHFVRHFRECVPDWTFTPNQVNANNWKVWEVLGAALKPMPVPSSSSGNSFTYSFGKPGIYSVNVETSGIQTFGSNAAVGGESSSPLTLVGRGTKMKMVVVPQDVALPLP